MGWGFNQENAIVLNKIYFLRISRALLTHPWERSNIPISELGRIYTLMWGETTIDLGNTFDNIIYIKDITDYINPIQFLRIAARSS